MTSPDGVGLLQESPAVGHGQWGAVAYQDLSLTL